MHLFCFVALEKETEIDFGDVLLVLTIKFFDSLMKINHSLTIWMRSLGT